MTNHCNDEEHSREAAEQKFETFHTETSTRRRKRKQQLEIIVRTKKEEKQVLIDNVTKFESEKLFRLVMDGNKRNTLSQ